MVKATLYDGMGNILIELFFEKGKAPKLSQLFKRYPAAERIEMA